MWIFSIHTRGRVGESCVQYLFIFESFIESVSCFTLDENWMSRKISYLKRSLWWRLLIFTQNASIEYRSIRINTRHTLCRTLICIQLKLQVELSSYNNEQHGYRRRFTTAAFGFDINYWISSKSRSQKTGVAWTYNMFDFQNDMMKS